MLHETSRRDRVVLWAALRRSAVALALAALLPNALPAQEPPAETPAEAPAEPPAENGLPVVRDEVTVEGRAGDYAASTADSFKTEAPLRLIPQAIQVVPRSVIDDQNALTLAEAVRNVSGTSNDFGFNGGSQPLLILRGFQTTSMTAASSMSGSSSFYLNGSKVQGIPINMANVESVEVIKGPATVLFGRGEPGGLVNVVSRAPRANRAWTFEQSGDDLGTSRTLIDATGPLNRTKSLLGRAAVSYSDVGSNRDFVEDRVGSFNGNLAWNLGERTRIDLTVDHTDQRYRNDFGIPAIGDRPADLPLSRQFNDAPELSRIRTDSFRLGYERAFDARWTLTARASSLRAKTREVDVWPYRIDLATFEDCLETRQELCRYYFNARPDGRYRAEQGTVDLQGRFLTGAVEHELLVGVDHYDTSKEGTTYLQFLPGVVLDRPASGAAPRLDISQSIPIETVDESRWTSAYVQDQMTLGSRGLHLVAGLRHDRTRAIYAAPGTEPNEQSFTKPRLGLVKELGATRSIYFQYQESVAANNGRDPVSLVALDAETAAQMEAGLKVASSSGRLQATLSAYQLVKKNRADYSLFPTIQTVGEARSRGIELDWSGEVSARLAMIGSYSYTDAVVTEDPQFEGTRLANVPRQSGSVWARFLVDRHWAVGGGVFCQGARLGDQANTFVLPGYARVDAMVSYDLNLRAARMLLQLNVDNVLDHRYYTGSHQFVRDWIQPGRPRTVTLAVRVDY